MTDWNYTTDEKCTAEEQRQHHTFALSDDFFEEQRRREQIYQQKKQQEQQQQEQQRQRKSTNNNNTNTSTISINYTHPGVFDGKVQKSKKSFSSTGMSYDEFMDERAKHCKPYEPTQQDFDLIVEAYCDNIGSMTGVVASMIEKAMSCGMTAEEVVMAIEETGMAPRPSPYYLRSVLRTWAETGFTNSTVHSKFYGNDATKWWKK